MNPIDQLKNSTNFPLYKRGIEGDLFIGAAIKSPLAPLLQRGEQVSRDAQISLNWLPA
jgi:hypothetical protein